MFKNLDFLRSEFFMKEPFVELKGETGIHFYTNHLDEFRPHFMLHTHSVIEILYFTTGIHKVICNNNEHIAHPGDVLLVRSFVPHELFAVDNQQCDHYVLQIPPSSVLCLADSFTSASYLLALSFSNSDSKCLWTREECDKNGLTEQFLRLIEERKVSGYCYDIVRNACSAQILCAMLRDTRSEFTISGEKEELKRRIYDTIVFIQRHFAEDITAEECAKNVSLSLYYFSRSFKTVTGRTFKEYLNLVRIYHANQLLSSTDKPITEIATDCGFNSVSHFIVTYKKSQNTTPLAYRKATKKI